VKIGHPAKRRVSVIKQQGVYTIYADKSPIVRSWNRRDARRLAVIVRRSLA